MNLEFLDVSELQNKLIKSNKKKIIFTLSNSIKAYLPLLSKIDYIIDNDKKIQGSFFNDIEIVSIDVLTEYNSAILILVGNHIESLFEQLKAFKNIEIIVLKNSCKNFFNLNDMYFSSDIKIEEKKKLFKKMVNIIDIELHSFCNRTCWFCPNSFIDRKKNTNHLDINLLKNIANDLSEINYSEYISFNGYSEPLSNELFYKKVSIIRERLPGAKLHINTNTDYLDNDSLLNAYQSGIRSMYIQFYLLETEEFSKDVVEKKVRKLKKKLSNIDFTLKYEDEERIEYTCIYKDMRIKAYARDFRKNGINRGDLQINKNEYIRKVPCTVSFEQVIINSYGHVLPCCHIRSDYEKHKNLVFDQLSENNNIFEIYFNKKAILWKKKLLKFDKKLPYPCTTCSFNLINDHVLNRSFIKKLSLNG